MLDKFIYISYLLRKKSCFAFWEQKKNTKCKFALNYAYGK